MDAKIYEPKPEIQAKKLYIITHVEEQDGKYGKYIRLTLKDNEEKEYSTALWVKQYVSQYSKLGAFITALGSDITTWTGKRINVISWEQGKRIVMPLEEKKSK